MAFKVSVVIPTFNVEKYLRETFESLLGQTLGDIEVIIVNDGSTDKTQDIIDEYCGKYENFIGINRPNIGVGNARNLGIEKASGKYVAFLDGDDMYTSDYLEGMYNECEKYNAQLAVGKVLQFSIFSETYFARPYQLSKLKNIDRYDRGLLWTLSLSNKLFLREKILETGLRIPPLKYSEDGAFVIPFALKCDKIVGSQSGALLYRKRPIWESASATQSASTELLNDYLSAHEIIYNAAEESFNRDIQNEVSERQREKLKEKKDSYLNELIFKETVIMINQFYRLFWCTDEETLNIIKEKWDSFKEKFTFAEYGKIIKDNFDISLKEFVTDKKEMAERPLVTVAVGCQKGGDYFEKMIASIYKQNMPSFEVILDESLKDRLPPCWADCENMHVLKTDTAADFKRKALANSKGRYIIFLDDEVIFGTSSLKNALRKMMAENVDFVTSEIFSLSGGKAGKYKTQEIFFKYSGSAKGGKRSKNEIFDLFLCNKLIDTDFLKSGKIQFLENSGGDAAKLFRNGVYTRLPGRQMFSFKTESGLIKILKSAENALPPYAVKSFENYEKTYYYRSRVIDTKIKAVKKIKAIIKKILGK